MIRFEAIHESTVVEKDEHRKSKEYKKLRPKMRTAVDDIFRITITIIYISFTIGLLY